MFTNLKRCRLKLKYLDKLILRKKIWPNDLKVGYNLPFNLIELVEGDFFRTKVTKMWKWVKQNELMAM